MFIEALFTTAKTWKQPKCPLTEEWIKKMWYTYTIEYYSAIKKNEIMLFICSNTNGPRDCHTEWTKSDREGEILYDIPYTRNLERNDANEFTYKIEAQTLRMNLWLPGENSWGRDS